MEEFFGGTVEDLERSVASPTKKVASPLKRLLKLKYQYARFASKLITNSCSKCAASKCVANHKK